MLPGAIRQMALPHTSVHQFEHVVTQDEGRLDDDMEGLQEESPVGEVEQQHAVEAIEQHPPHDDRNEVDGHSHAVGDVGQRQAASLK